MRLGIDVGGTKTEAVAVADDGSIVARTRRPTRPGGDAVVATIRDVIDVVVAQLGDDAPPIASIGIGVPGLVEPGSTRVRHAVNLGVSDLDLVGSLRRVYAAPIAIENDVKAAAVGAYALQGCTGAMAYLNVGTGVAAGVVANGILWHGARGVAGEIGHVSIDPAGPECRCGQRGCIEALAGGGSIAARWDRAGEYPVREVLDAADEGYPPAMLLRDDLARGVAAAVRVLVLTLDVDRVVVGGGVTALGGRMLAPVVAQLRSSAEQSEFLGSLGLTDRVSLLPPDVPAAAVGAALTATPNQLEA